MKNKKTYILIISFIAITAMFWNVLTAPGIKELKGNFKEVAFIRNEQNTGPVIRIYAVSVDDTYWREMEQYGTYMPHNKFGTTRVYFFLNKQSYPEKLTLGSNNFEDRFMEYCIGIYEKDAMGQVSFIKYPYKNR